MVSKSPVVSLPNGLNDLWMGVTRTITNHLLTGMILQVVWPYLQWGNSLSHRPCPRWWWRDATASHSSVLYNPEAPREFSSNTLRHEKNPTTKTSELLRLTQQQSGTTQQTISQTKIQHNSTPPRYNLAYSGMQIYAYIPALCFQLQRHIGFVISNCTKDPSTPSWMTPKQEYPPGD